MKLFGHSDTKIRSLGKKVRFSCNYKLWCQLKVRNTTYVHISVKSFTNLLRYLACHWREKMYKKSAPFQPFLWEFGLCQVLRPNLWTRFSRVVRASDCQCQSRKSPGIDLSILRHSSTKNSPLWIFGQLAVLDYTVSGPSVQQADAILYLTSRSYAYELRLTLKSYATLEFFARREELAFSLKTQVLFLV
jgi:hypothetical protein